MLQIKLEGEKVVNYEPIPNTCDRCCKPLNKGETGICDECYKSIKLEGREKE